MDKRLALTIQFAAADKLSGALRSISGLADKGGRAIGKLTRQSKKLESQLADVQGKLGSGSFAPGLVMAERELKKAIANTNRELERRKAFMSIDNKVSAMHGQADRYMAAGRDNMIAGAGMIAPFVIAGRAAMDYDKKLALIGQKTDMTRVQTKVLGAELLRAAQATKQMPDQIIAGADFLTSKGLGVAELRGMMPALGTFSTAWDADVVDGARAAYSVYSSLKVPLDQTSRALEVMAAAGKAGGFEVKDMAQFFPELTGQLSALGSKGLGAVGDLSAALQVLEAQTGDGATAANNLKNLLSFAQTERGAKQFEKFGIDVSTALKRAAKEGRSPIEELVKLTNQATSGDASKIALLFSDQQAASAMRALVLREKQYLDIRKAAMTSSGLTEKEFTRMSETASANWQDTKRSLTTLAISLGTHLLPLVNKGIQLITRVTNKVAAWAQRNPKTAQTILTIVGSLGAFRVGLGVLQFAFGGMLKPLATAWGWLRKFQAIGGFARAATIAAKGFQILRTAALFMAKGVVRAGLMMMANPMVLAVMAIVAAVAVAGYLIYTHWDTIKGAFDAGVAMIGAAWENIKTKFWEGVAFLQALPSKMLAMGRAIIQGLANGILAAPGAVWNALKSVVMGGIEGVKNFLGIKSPSRLFMGFGGDITERLARGVERTGNRPIASIGRLATGVAGAMAVSASPAYATAGGSPGGVAATAPSITINVTQRDGENGEALAQRVAQLIEHKQRVTARSSYRDG